MTGADLAKGRFVYDLNTLSVNCGNDPLVTYLVTQYDDMLAPKITRIINKLLETGYAQIDLKHAKITPVIQKALILQGQIAGQLVP